MSVWFFDGTSTVAHRSAVVSVAAMASRSPLAFFDTARFLPLPLPLLSATSIAAFILPFLAKNRRSPMNAASVSLCE